MGRKVLGSCEPTKTSRTVSAYSGKRTRYSSCVRDSGRYWNSNKRSSRKSCLFTAGSQDPRKSSICAGWFVMSRCSKKSQIAPIWAEISAARPGNRTESGSEWVIRDQAWRSRGNGRIGRQAKSPRSDYSRGHLSLPKRQSSRCHHAPTRSVCRMKRGSPKKRPIAAIDVNSSRRKSI
jgi:hypothetical protein